MKRKYLLKSSFNTARLTRLIAKFIDLFIVAILSVIFYPVGLILAIIYMGLSDSLNSGQSVGKRLMGFSVISLKDGEPCSLRQSVVRNLPFLIPMLFALIPLWGWIISSILALPLVLLEVYLLFRLDSAHRLGDVMADTSVTPNDPDMQTTHRKPNSWFHSEKNLSPCNRSML